MFIPNRSFRNLSPVNGPIDGPILLKQLHTASQFITVAVDEDDQLLVSRTELAKVLVFELREIPIR